MLVRHKNLGWLQELRIMFSAVVIGVVLAACGGGGSGGGEVTGPLPDSSVTPSPSAIVSPTGIVVAASVPPEIRLDQQCSLIEAIINANNDDSTYSDCAAGIGADVIVLPASSSQRLTAAHNSVYGPTGLPVIASAITIQGNGSTISRESNAPSFRILAVAKGAELHLHETTISGGASVRYGDPSLGGGVGYGSPSQGGGVLNYGTLDVNNSNISDNSSVLGGGGVHSEGGTLIVRDSVLSSNFAEGAGGAINLVRASGVLLNNECSENTAGLDGGCMWAGATSTVTVSNCTIRDNYGKAGGGLRAEWNSVLIVNNSTVSQNRAWGRGGGVSNGSHATVFIFNSTIDDNASDFYGGGVLAAGTFTLVKDSTLSGNTAPRGGGIATGSSGTTGGTIKVMSSTVAYNRAAERGGGIINLAPRPFILSHSLIAGNTAMDQQSEVDDSTGTVIANDFNLFGHDGDAGIVGLQAGINDIVASSSLNAILDSELRNNGGPTRTHALIAGSQAIDAGDPRFSNMEAGGEWMYDQRGANFVRFDAERGIVDIGAFEAR